MFRPRLLGGLALAAVCCFGVQGVAGQEVVVEVSDSGTTPPLGSGDASCGLQQSCSAASGTLTCGDQGTCTCTGTATCICSATQATCQCNSASSTCQCSGIQTHCNGVGSVSCTGLQSSCNGGPPNMNMPGFSLGWMFFVIPCIALCAAGARYLCITGALAALVGGVVGGVRQQQMRPPVQMQSGVYPAYPAAQQPQYAQGQQYAQPQPQFAQGQQYAQPQAAQAVYYPGGNQGYPVAQPAAAVPYSNNAPGAVPYSNNQPGTPTGQPVVPTAPPPSFR